MRKLLTSLVLVANLLTISVTDGYELKKQICAKGGIRRCMSEFKTGDSLRDMMINQKKGEDTYIKEEFLTYVNEQLVDEFFKFEQALHTVIHANIQDFYFEQGHHIAENHIKEMIYSPEIKIIMQNNQEQFQQWLEGSVAKVKDHFAEMTVQLFKQQNKNASPNTTHHGAHSATSIAFSEMDRMFDEIYYENQDNIIERFKDVILEVSNILKETDITILEDGQVEPKHPENPFQQN